MFGFRGEQPHIEIAAVWFSFGSLVELQRKNLTLPPNMGSAAAAESRTNVEVAK